MSEAELARPSVNQTTPRSKQQLRERIAADTQEFLDAGGEIRRDYGWLSDDAEMPQHMVARLLKTDGVVIATAIRRGRLYGKVFPQPLTYRKRVPVWRAGDIFDFYRSL